MADYSALATALRKSREAPTPAEALAAVGVNVTGDGPLHETPTSQCSCSQKKYEAVIGNDQ